MKSVSKGTINNTDIKPLSEALMVYFIKAYMRHTALVIERH